MYNNYVCVCGFFNCDVLSIYRICDICYKCNIKCLFHIYILNKLKPQRTSYIPTGYSRRRKIVTLRP